MKLKLSHIFYLILLISQLLSCGSHQNGHEKRYLRDSVINKIDTLQYRPVGHGFYINANGDLFESKRTAKFPDDKDDSLWLSILYLDSTIVVDDYERPESLKKYIDLNSYSDDSFSVYSKDKKHVYYYRGTSDGGVRFLIKKADPRTFQELKGNWGKDASYVFYEGTIVEDADPSGFYVYENSHDTASDGKSIFVNGIRQK